MCRLSVLSSLRRLGAKRFKGFTLVEVVVVIALLGIVAAIAAPNFQDLLQSRRQLAARQDLMATLGQARSAAIAQNRLITVCGSGDGVRCDGQWGSGWLAFADLNDNQRLDAGEDVVRSVRQLPSGVNVEAAAGRVVFSNRGQPAPALTFEVRASDAGVLCNRQVQLMPSGSTRAIDQNC